MAHAEKRNGKATGRWTGRVRLTSGKEFQKTYDSMKAAEGYETYVRLMGEEPPTVSKGSSSGPTFKEVADDCKDAGGPNGRWHNGRDKSVLQRLQFVVDKIGHYCIYDVNRRLIREKVIDDLKKRPGYEGRTSLSKGTINRYVSAGSAVLTWAVDEEIIDTKPRLPFTEEDDAKKRDIFRFGQEGTVLAVMEKEGHVKVALSVRVLLNTGLRVSEFYKLVPEQIIDISTHNKEGEQIETSVVDLRQGETKNDDPRLVTIDRDLARELRAMVASDTRPRYRHLLSVFKATCKKCGQTGNLVLHSTRHTRNTSLRQAGVDMKTRMQMLGHKSTKTSMGYDHVDLDDQLEAAKKVENRSGQSAPKGTIVPFGSKRDVG